MKFTGETHKVYVRNNIKFGTTSIPVPDILVSSVPPPKTTRVSVYATEHAVAILMYPGRNAVAVKDTTQRDMTCPV